MMAIIGKISVLLLLTGTGFGADPDMGCSRSGTIFADPKNCADFYMCDSNHQAIHMHCPSGTYFSIVSDVCDHMQNVDCMGRPEPGDDSGTTTSTTTSAPPATQPPATTTTTTTSTPTTTRAPTTTTTKAPTTSTSTTTQQTTTRTTSTTASTTTPMMTTTTTTSTTTTTERTTTTTTTSPPSTGIRPYPAKALGMYIVITDDDVPGYETSSDWTPKLYDYQQTGANVLFFTFINPDTMEVPKAFANLARTRGTGGDGAIPDDTVIIFAIGGLKYSVEINPWHWLTSQSAAEAMAEKVATWVDTYGIDGIDLDIEEGAGDTVQAGTNMVHFVRRLKQLQPNMLVGQPTYGYPQIQAEIEVINHSWNVDSSSNRLADSVGIMVYEGTQSLNYVDNYAHGTDQWEGFPITVNVADQDIMVGCKGTETANNILALARESESRDLLGIMVWFASVRGGFQYEVSWDASEDAAAQQAYVDALALMKQS